jgi:hypothetical protein
MNRSEMKFIIDYPLYYTMLRDIAPFVKEDLYGVSGEYQVFSIYYDTRDFLFFREKVDGEKIRSKVRIRTYKDVFDAFLLDQEYVFLEVKKRYDKTIQKKRARVLLKHVDEILHKGPNKRFINCMTDQEVAALCEASYLVNKLHLQQTVAVHYRRHAFADTAGIGLRITFDKDIKYRKTNVNFHRDNVDITVLPPHLMVMEIKSRGVLPQWLTHIMSQHGCLVRTFSKYCQSISNDLGITDDMVY